MQSIKEQTDALPRLCLSPASTIRSVRLLLTAKVEIVDKALAYIREWNMREKKPIITERHKFFQLSEVVRKVKEQQEKLANMENKEYPF